MSDIFRKIQSGISIRTLSTSPTPSVQGDFNVDTSSGDIQYHNGTALAHVTTNSNTATFTNKTLDATLNTLSNIANANIAAGAAIAYSKLALTGSILNADLAGNIAYNKLVLTGSILNADLAGSIAYSKLVLSASIQNSDLATMPTHTIKGNITSGTAAPVDLTYSQVNTALGTITGLSSDVSATGTGGTAAATVNSVGGSSAANVHAAELLANAATASATASTIVKRDTNGNTQINNIKRTLTVNSSSTAFTVASSYYQSCSGPAALTFTLPDATTLQNGHSFCIIAGVGTTTVNINGGSNLLTFTSGQARVVLTSNLTTAGIWSSAYSPTTQSNPITLSSCRYDTPTASFSSSPQLLKFTNKFFDNNNNYSASTGLFTVTAPSNYRVTSSIQLNSSFAAGNTFQFVIYKNGSPYSQSYYTIGASTVNTTVFVSDEIPCNSTDTLAVYLASTVSGSPSYGDSRLIITQVPQSYYS